ncbi:protein phosphatase 2C domain-containing protein [Citricoccus sp. NR2]|uniref:protein phosphatase 2C domain-containing protein n=1 Tax=Citricoccus sp. NR2 TaxID=3004095 RepID=UPI0022DE9506|nr:PP2C family serine/threonine-protein phosphatase [Citricoccus sp. NR2]WBL18858.1 protein phosphatase 2C domain-containing protein [Citricoccus sp. NR2]
MTSQIYRYRAGAATDVGLRRELNEDSLLVMDDLFAVADGMGGHDAGEVASSSCVQALREMRQDMIAADPPQHMDLEALRSMIGSANTSVLVAGQGRAGTTLTMLAGIRHDDPAGEHALAVANIGDSRAYWYQAAADQMVQITEDHSAVQELVNRGIITAEEARTHPDRNVITRAVGTSPHIAADVAVLRPEPGDRFLLCSDGLTNEVSDDDLAWAISSGDDLDAIAHDLVDQANEAGGRDNITVIIVEILS